MRGLKAKKKKQLTHANNKIIIKPNLPCLPAYR